MIEAKILISPETAARFRKLIGRDDFERAPVSVCFEAVLIAGMNALRDATVKLPRRADQKELI